MSYLSFEIDDTETGCETEMLEHVIQKQYDFMLSEGVIHKKRIS